MNFEDLEEELFGDVDSSLVSIFILDNLAKPLPEPIRQMQQPPPFQVTEASGAMVFSDL
jgi:hypothetical protein